MNKRYPFPEIVSGEGGWKIFEDTERPRTSNISKEMYVPVGDKCIECGSYHDKQIRRHELAHVKWSPKTLGKLGPDESEITVEVIEEIRVNYLLAQKEMGIEDWVLCPEKIKLAILTLIHTASEFEIICYLLASMWRDNMDIRGDQNDIKPNSREYLLFLDIYNDIRPILTEVRKTGINWAIEKANYFYLKLLRKGKYRHFHYGSKTYQPPYRKTRVVAKELNLYRDNFNDKPKPEEVLESERQKKLAQQNKANQFANMKSDSIGKENITDSTNTLEAAQLKTKQDLYEMTEGKLMGKINYSTEEGYKGQWGNMDIIQAPLEINLQGQIKQGRKYRPQDYGTNPKYMNRWCIDKKVFKQQQRVYGGTILIDVSGSMSLCGNDILEIMQELPAVTIAMYNYKGWRVRYDSSRKPTGTLRIIGKDGKRVTEEYLEEHTGGSNLIDGPALKWLGKMPSKRIWVSDMFVFGMGNSSQINLIQECAQIMKQNGIIRLANINQVKKFALDINRLE